MSYLCVCNKQNINKMTENKVTSMSALGGLGVLLIADSGSTKTHWCLVRGGSVVSEIYTDGINPFYQTDMEIIALLDTQLIPNLNVEDVEKTNQRPTYQYLLFRKKTASAIEINMFNSLTIQIWNKLRLEQGNDFHIGLIKRIDTVGENFTHHTPTLHQTPMCFG